MNDYKELVAELEEFSSLNDENLQSLIIENNDLQNALVDAADVIEQLVRERDAAVADLKSELERERGLNQCRYCKYQEGDSQCPPDCIPYSEKWGWEWRGLEGKHE